jgi:serine phosphatase RsbU (regulator of sigma subunit)
MPSGLQDGISSGPSISIPKARQIRVDVSGHGVGSALLATSVMDVLRTRALPDTDFRDPGAVLTALNAAFQMSDLGNRYFTMWYGVYDRRDRSLAFPRLAAIRPP